jgi:hypothetical protein
VTVYNKNLSSQYNLPAQIERAQDKTFKALVQTKR